MIVKYENKELKQQLKLLENKYQSLSVKKDELLAKIEEFNNEYNLKFGNILNQIFDLESENLYKKIELRKIKKEKLLKDKNKLDELITKRDKLQAKLDKVIHDIKLNGKNDELLFNKQELEIALSEVNSQINFIEENNEKIEKEINIQSDEELKEEYEEIKNSKKEFEEELKESEKIKSLNKDENKELKNIYRKFSKLIHPDIVAEKYKEEAKNLMAKLNELFRLKDLEAIKKMYNEFVDNKNFIEISEELENEDELQKQIYKIRDKIIEIQKEIDELLSNDIFDIIEKKEEYFNEIKEKLEIRINDLKSEKSYLDINIMKYKEM